MARGKTSSTGGAEKPIPALSNLGYFSDYYLVHRLDSGLGDLYARWEAAEKRGEPTDRTRLRALTSAFGRLRADAALTAPAADVLDTDRLDLGQLPPDGRDALLKLNDAILDALGWTPERGATLELTSGDKTVKVPVAHRCDTPTGVLLLALDTVFATDPAAVIASKTTPAGRLVEPLLVNGKPAGHTALEAAQLIFTADEAPSYVLLVSGGAVTLLDRDRWGEGISLGANLDDALARHDTKPKGELAAIAGLFSAGAINPGDEAQSVLTSLLERANTESAGVSKELRHGIRRSIEILANAVVRDVRYRRKGAWMAIEPKDLTRQSLRYLYRIIVLLFAEARPELGILPSDDPDYQAGYSMARLRDTALVELHSDHARNARHLQRSLEVLFRLVNDGHRAEQTLSGDDARELTFPGLRSALFGSDACPLIDQTHLADEVLQQVIANLCFTREKAGQRRRAVSYSTLGINQLGAVYEGLMAYSGFLAKEPLFEVDKDADPDNGSWVIPVDRADEFPEEVFLNEETLDGSTKRVRYEEGDFVFRLSGRDRQRSASYYTPEVLTEFTVRNALDVLFDENPGLRAADILNLTVCEPALGSGAFLAEAISQLAERYLKAAQDESGDVIDADRYQLELQRAKAHFAVNQAHGVDLNQTAVELAEVSLWLSCMHAGLMAPWFGARLRCGNSLVGARRATYTAEHIKSAVFPGKSAIPPADKPLSATPLGSTVGIHHFLVPGQGWGAACDAKEIKELDPDWVRSVRAWRKNIQARPTPRHVDRLQHLAARVEELWKNSAQEVGRFWTATRQHIDVWGADTPAAGERFGEAAIREVLDDPRSATSRLRALMDAWCSLWLWGPQHGTALPSLDEWLTVAEALLRIDEPWDSEVLFGDERKLALPAGNSIEDVAAAHPWLVSAREIAATQTWFHWELEFSPVFARGGFDLQVGNPPWVRPIWKDFEALAEHDAAFAIVKADDAAIQTRRTALLENGEVREIVLGERAELAGLTALVTASSTSSHPRGVQLNLYLAFITAVIRRTGPSGAAGLLHPESHFADPEAADFRSVVYRHLRRHWQFANHLFIFPEVDDNATFGVHVYAAARQPRFRQASYILAPAVVDRSIEHDGTGEVPGVQFADGSWDLRPHRSRIVDVTYDTLREWVTLFDVPGTPPQQARLFRPLTSLDLAALSVFAQQPHRFGTGAQWTWAGFHEKGARDDGTIRSETSRQPSLADAVLQGPHILNSAPFAQEPGPGGRGRGDWHRVSYEDLPAAFVPRTNFARAASIVEFERRQQHQGTRVANCSLFREAHREFVHPRHIRTLQSCILPPGPSFVGTLVSITMDDSRELARWSGLLASLPYDYLIKTSGVTHIKQYVTSALPVPQAHRELDDALVHRVARLNCVTKDYAPFWTELWQHGWTQDAPTDETACKAWALLQHVSGWGHQSWARADYLRWQLQVETDALVALLLGIAQRQLIGMYRSQFAVLRRYEASTIFDGAGRQLSAAHQAHGYLQAEVDATVKSKRGGTRIWDRVLAFRSGETDVELRPFVLPFRTADREAAMTRAYWTFVDRYALTPPDGAERPT